MPDYFSHRALAHTVLKKLDTNLKSKITSRTLYLLGAQGGDLFYTYKLSFTKSNLGKIMHHMQTDILFEKLLQGNLSFAAGFATHYALDSVFHPIVYAFESKKRSPLTHYGFEGDLGIFICEKLNVTRRIIPYNELIKCTFAVYDSARRVESSVTVTGVERCLKRFFAASQVLYRSRRFTYKYDYDYNKLERKLNEAEGLALKAVTCVLNGQIDKEVFSGRFLYGDK